VSQKFRVVLATRNQGKVTEFRRILEEYSAGEIKLLGLQDFPEMPDVEESGSTFEANALLKAHATAEFTKLPAIADDSGICIDFLDGAPGIFSARWAGQHGDDEANLQKVLREMSGITADKRGAQFRCVVALAHPNGEYIYEEGVMHGEIVDSPRGESGFGYDPIFQPTGFTQTSAQLSAIEKDEISHRGKALRAITGRIAPFLGALR
jgi:XTP/dITP diphosphohydrolase